MSDNPTIIVFALFPGVTQLDFTGPHQVLSRLPGAQVLLASRTGEPIETDGIILPGCGGSPTSHAATSSACRVGSAPPTTQSPTRNFCGRCGGWPTVHVM